MIVSGKRFMAILIAFLCIAPACPGSTEAGSVPLRIAFVESAFLTVNKADAVAAITVWVETLLKNRGLSQGSSVDIYPDTDALEQAILRGEADVIPLAASDYLQMKGRVPLDPVYLAVQRGHLADRYSVLVHKDSGITALDQVARGTILFMQSGHMLLGWPWLETMLREERVDSRPEKIDTGKILGAVMPVFLKQKTACLVPYNSFLPAAELNPQLGRELKVIASSEPLSTALVAMRSGFRENRAVVMEELGVLHQKPQGQQIMMLLKYEKLVPYDDSALDTTRDLMGRAGLPFDNAKGGPAVARGGDSR